MSSKKCYRCYFSRQYKYFMYLHYKNIVIWSIYFDGDDFRKKIILHDFSVFKVNRNLCQSRFFEIIFICAKRGLGGGG